MSTPAALAFLLAATLAPRPVAAADVTRPTGVFVALSVRDLAASIRWYADTLDLRAGPIQGGAGEPQVCVLEGDAVIVELLHMPGAMSLTSAAPQVKGTDYVYGIVKAGILVADFDAVLAKLRARGVTIAYGPYPARGGQRANVIVKDAEGNLLQFFGPK
jgi:catechol 2,3-dioxygenase-like lactoylglutathione lyase family enzyme